MSAVRAAALASLPPGLVWQAGAVAQPAADALPSGFPALDAVLPGGGWPRGALIELLVDHPGVGELELLLPLLRKAPPERWIAWIAPPLLPYAPALAAAGVALDRLLLTTPATRAETLWATRQALVSGACALVLAWPLQPDTAALRRLQLAAEESGTPLFLFRPAADAVQPSPAVLRLRLAADGDALAVHVVKRRGPALAGPIHLSLRAGPPAGTPQSSFDHDAVVRADPARSAPADLHAGRR